MMTTIIAVLLVLSIILPFGIFLKGQKTKSRLKGALASNVFSFFSILVVATVCMFGGNALAAEEAVSNVTGIGYIAAALVTGLSTVGAGIAVASAASAALGAISENDKIMGKALIFVALAEGIALYGLLVSFTILGRI